MSENPDPEAAPEAAPVPTEAANTAAPEGPNAAAPEAARPEAPIAPQPEPSVVVAPIPVSPYPLAADTTPPYGTPVEAHQAVELPPAEPPPVEPAPYVKPKRRRLGPRGFAMLARGTLMLAAIAVCVAAFVIQMTGMFRVNDAANLRDFVNRNTVTPHARLLMLIWLGAAGLCGTVLGLVLYLWRRKVRPPYVRAARVFRTGRLFAPLLLPPLVRPLLIATEWDALARASGVAGVTLLADLCFRAAATELAAGRIALARLIARISGRVSAFFARSRRVAPETMVVYLGVVFYAVWMSYGTILQHRQFGTAAFDLGNYDNMFFNLMHGRPFRTMSVLPEGKTWSMLSNHAELTMFVLVPFYALRPNAETLLIMQATALALGAIPLYRFAARHLPRPAAMGLAIAYLLYAPMHQANYYDIHFQPFAVPCTLWVLYALDAQKPFLFTVSFLLAIGCREDVPIGFIVLGVYLLLIGKRTRMALVMTIVATAYFVVIKVVVMPRFGNWWFNDFYKELYPAGENTYGGIVKTLLSNPSFVFKTLITTEKIVLLLLVLTPVAFLPMRRGLLWMSLLPGIPFTILTTAYWPTVSISFQYILIFVPFLFTATALALAALRDSAHGRQRLWAALGSIAVATFLTTRVWGAMPPGDKFKGGFRDIPSFRPVSPAEKQKLKDIKELAAKIPANAPISVSEMEHPHVSNHMDVMTLRVSYAGAAYILYAEDSGGFGGDIARRALEQHEYELVERRPSGMTLLRKTAKK